MSSRKPCAECPFARSTPPGGTGGTCPTVYVGQAVGPFLLPCHMDPAYQADRRSPNLLQCAGAAIFRQNIGVASKMPQGMLRLEQDTERVFATCEELVAHHMRIPLPMAEFVLIVTPPALLLRKELQKAGCQVVDQSKIRRS